MLVYYVQWYVSGYQYVGGYYCCGFKVVFVCSQQGQGQDFDVQCVSQEVVYLFMLGFVGFQWVDFYCWVVDGFFYVLWLGGLVIVGWLVWVVQVGIGQVYECVEYDCVCGYDYGELCQVVEIVVQCWMCGKVY